jgi:hypothetical protein
MGFVPRYMLKGGSGHLFMELFEKSQNFQMAITFLFLGIFKKAYLQLCVSRYFTSVPNFRSKSQNFLNSYDLGVNLGQGVLRVFVKHIYFVCRLFIFAYSYSTGPYKTKYTQMEDGFQRNPNFIFLAGTPTGPPQNFG